MTVYWSTRNVVYTNECLGIVLKTIALLAERPSMIHQLATMARMPLRDRLCYLYLLLVGQSLVDI
jgi:hypothetical protein